MLVNRRDAPSPLQVAGVSVQVWKLRLPSRPWRLRPAELRQDQSQLPESLR